MRAVKSFILLKKIIELFQGVRVFIAKHILGQKVKSHAGALNLFF